MTDRGKWREPGVPHKGWKCIDTFDSCPDGDDLHYTCEMCETQSIRFVHVMVHPDDPVPLNCGCVCAESMADDYVNPRRRERQLRNTSARSRTALIRDAENRLQSRWHDNRLHVDARRITVLEGDGGWKLRLQDQQGVIFGRRVYESAGAARDTIVRWLIKRQVEEHGIKSLRT